MIYTKVDLHAIQFVLPSYTEIWTIVHMVYFLLTDQRIHFGLWRIFQREQLSSVAIYIRILPVICK